MVYGSPKCGRYDYDWTGDERMTDALVKVAESQNLFVWVSQEDASRSE